MKATSTQYGGGCSRGHARLFLFLVCLGSIAASGCFLRRTKAQPFPWGAAASARPYPPGPSATQTDATDEGPDLQLQVAPPPSPLVAVRSGPPRPRVAAVTPTAPTEVPSKPEVPQIAPQLSAAEANAAQQQMNASLNVAERNIGATQGKNLNAGQLDLASKVRSFILEAREAANAGDWTRARNAAKKAQVLSEELASSM